MNKMRKAASLLLALVMVCALSLTAFAEDETKYTITINNATDGYVYTAYQIFAGDLSEDGTTLSNVTWGSGIDSTNGTLQAALTTAYGTTDAAEVAALITTEAQAEAFAKVVGSYLTTGTDSTDAGDTYTISVNAAGYYLIANTTVPAPSGAYTSYILEVAGDVEVSNIKSSYPTIDKEVSSTTDSTDTDTNETTADYSVDDNVPFELIATLPSNYGDYTTYKLTFHDTMDSALSFNNDVVVTVYVDGNTSGTETVVNASGYSVATSTSGTMTDTTCTFEVQIPNVKTLTDTSGSSITLTSDSKIVVSFTAKLTAEASTGETNKAYLEYSNNPNETSGGTTGKTPEDVTTVFTFTLDVSKVDSSSSALEGAGFTLYKKNASNEYVAVDSEATAEYQALSSLSAFETGVTYYTSDGTTYTEVADTSGTPDSSTTYYVKNQFTFEGLGIGDYKLEETTTPNGYNTMEDIYFTISATTTESSQVGSVSSLSVNVTDSSGEEITSGAQSFTTTTSSGAISTKIVNEKGSTLPSTGGIGTTIFYVVGGLLAFGAAVLLITRKRMDKTE